MINKITLAAQPTPLELAFDAGHMVTPVVLLYLSLAVRTVPYAFLEPVVHRLIRKSAIMFGFRLGHFPAVKAIQGPACIACQFYTRGVTPEAFPTVSKYKGDGVAWTVRPGTPSKIRILAQVLVSK